MIDSIITYFLICWQKTFNYQGRARRLELWSFILITLIMATGIQMIEMGFKEYIYAYTDLFNLSYFSITVKDGYTIKEPHFVIHFITCLYLLASIFPLFAVTGRRLQDLNRSKYWIFYLLLPLFIMLAIFIRVVITVHFGKDILDIGGYWGYILLPFLIYNVVLTFKVLFQEGKPEKNKYCELPKLEEN